MKILILYKFELQIKMWKDQQAENENGQLDQSAQQEIYLSKLDNISSYLKSINQRLYQTVCAGKKPHSKTHLLSTITNFDKCIEDYNNYYFRKRLSRLLYFKIDPLAIQREQNFFDYKLYHKEKNVQERVYFIKFVYSKGDNQFYRMHVEIWKHDGHNVITNQILSRFQKNLTNDLIEGLKEKGFISHFQENSVTLKCKRPNHKNPLKSTHEQLNLMDCIQSIGETFLKQMIPVLSKEHICPYCGKHLIYQSRLGLMVPPTIIISTFKQTGTGTREQNREQKYKILHETCSLKYMKPNVPAIELRGNNEIRQQNQVQGQGQVQTQ